MFQKASTVVIDTSPMNLFLNSLLLPTALLFCPPPFKGFYTNESTGDKFKLGTDSSTGSLTNLRNGPNAIFIFSITAGTCSKLHGSETKVGHCQMLRPPIGAPRIRFLPRKWAASSSGSLAFPPHRHVSHTRPKYRNKLGPSANSSTPYM